MGSSILERVGYPSHSNIKRAQNRHANQLMEGQPQLTPEQSDAEMEALMKAYGVPPVDKEAVRREAEEFERMRQEHIGRRNAAESLGNNEMQMMQQQAAQQQAIQQQQAQQQQFAEQLEEMIANDPGMAEQLLMKLKSQAGQNATQNIGAIQELINKF